MGFRNGAYATVWEVKRGNGNWHDVRLSISRKNRSTGEYETEFSGNASESAAFLGERARIRIGECDVTNRYDREKNVTYTNYAVFSFEDLDGSAPGSPANNSSGGSSYDFRSYEEDESLPFN